MPTLEWTVTEFAPARSFCRVSRSAGVTTTAGHRLTPAEGSSITVTLSIRQAGPPAPVVGLLTGPQTRRHVDTEAPGPESLV
jgi:hypothetical protein